MPLKKITDDALDAINTTLGGELSESQRLDISNIIKQALVRSVESASTTQREAIIVCCGSDADLAHKIAEEANQATVALIANLMSMR